MEIIRNTILGQISLYKFLFPDSMINFVESCIDIADFCCDDPSFVEYYIVENNLTFLEGNVVKYITRHRRKGEGASDIEKVIHYCELILEKDYGRK